MNTNKLEQIAKSLSISPKGILAADESTNTISKRFDQINLESNFENRRKYRELLFCTNGIEDFLSGVIFYDETIKQKTSENLLFVELLKQKNIQTGIKVDTGAKKLIGSENEKITEGLDGLSSRMREYKSFRATFSKWRAVIKIDNSIPTEYCIELNAIILARYARIVQEFDIVPIVEPEVLMDGSHSIEDCYEVTSKTLRAVFKQLKFQGVFLNGILLKPNMIISGEDKKERDSVKEVSNATIKCLMNNVPHEVPGIVFLSGGQSNELATKHLNEMNKTKNLPWSLSFSYGRALQQPVISSWMGKDCNIHISQKELLKRCKLNSLATLGQYEDRLELIKDEK